MDKGDEFDWRRWREKCGWRTCV